LNRLCARAWRGTAPIPTITRFLEKSWRQLTVIAHSEWMTANPSMTQIWCKTELGKCRRRSYQNAETSP
jgi:hypothetical protein